MLAFLVVSIGVTAVLMWIEMTLLRSLLAAAGTADAEFRFFAAGDWTLAAIQVYLVVLFLAMLAFVTVEVLSSRLGGTGDYEGTLAAVCYGLAPVVALSIPQVTLGFSFVTLVNPLVTALVVAVPALAAVGWLMTVGVAERHDLPRQRAAVPVVGTFLVWLLAGLWVAVSVA